MEAKRTILTIEEREVLILAASRQCDQHLNNTEISQRLGIPVTRVKALIRQARLKLGAGNRHEAIHLAMRRGEIKLNEFYSPDELAEFWNSLYPDILKRMIKIIRKGHFYQNSPVNNEQTIRTERRQDTLLTDREREVLILVGRGLTNKEIADRLYVSTSAVRIYLYRACTKLGAHRRADAAMLALKRGEISIGDMYTFDEFLEAIAPLGAEFLEKVAQVLKQRFGQEPVSISS